MDNNKIPKYMNYFTSEFTIQMWNVKKILMKPTYLGPAEKGMKANSSFSDWFSGANLSGRYSSGSFHTEGIWCKTYSWMRRRDPAGIWWPSMVMSCVVCRWIAGTGVWRRNASLMHMVKCFNFGKSSLKKFKFATKVSQLSLNILIILCHFFFNCYSITSETETTLLKSSIPCSLF